MLTSDADASSLSASVCRAATSAGVSPTCAGTKPARAASRSSLARIASADNGRDAPGVGPIFGFFSALLEVCSTAGRFRDLEECGARVTVGDAGDAGATYSASDSSESSAMMSPFYAVVSLIEMARPEERAYHEDVDLLDGSTTAPLLTKDTYRVWIHIIRTFVLLFVVILV
jgi:hypothetical protein